METIKGYVDRIVFRNEENGYTVLHLVSSGDEITCVGNMAMISEGEMIEATGRYTSHASYGEQFQVESMQVCQPEDEEAIVRYLGSGAIRGVGTALADRIVRKFKADTFRVIEQEPERLAEIKGISEKKARDIAQQVEEKREMRDAMLFLAQYGISTALSVKVYKQYGNEIYHVIKENPYRLADDITGVGFRIADEIARRAGILADSDFRIRSGILYVLQQAAGDGHVYLPLEELTRRTSLLLGFIPENTEDYLRDLAVEKKVVVRQEEEETRVYASALFYLEQNSAHMLHDLNISCEVDTAQIFEKIRKIEKRTGTWLDEHQKEAVLETVRCGLMILTGGPGTGKTTTINTMISYFEEEGLEIALAAPTGRAAKRMTEATGHEARTIHRLLEVEGGPDGEASSFARNAQNPLEADVIIVDEMSMVDIFLMHALLNAITVGTRLILVGDVNQLPSVGPGCVLRDLIDSQVCRVVRLTKIFRQAEQSDIVVNAHKINQGQHMALDNKSRDFFFLKRQDPNVIISIAIQLISQKLPGYVNASWRDIQVLTPTRKGLLGVERLNKILQQYLNPESDKKREYQRGDMIFREGDKVMQIRNNYQLTWEIRGKYGVVADSGTGVFNGDIGTVTEVNLYTEKLTVEYDEHRYVEYPFNGLEELELANAVTIHKAQGSEYPAVVIPLLDGPRMLMNRNLIYTAVTRARSCVTLVGDPDVFFRMIDNTAQYHRYTALALRLRSCEEEDQNRGSQMQD